MSYHHAIISISIHAASLPSPEERAMTTLKFGRYGGTNRKQTQVLKNVDDLQAINRILAYDGRKKMDPGFPCYITQTPLMNTTYTRIPVSWHLFLKLPNEIKIKIMKLLLVSSTPINLALWRDKTNRKILSKSLEVADIFANNKSGKQAYADIRRYPEFTTGIHPNIMFTNKFFYYEGMKILYQENTFRFARVSYIRNPGTKTIIYADGNDICGFLAQTHHLLPDQRQQSETLSVMKTRADLIRKVILHDFDTDSDELSKMQYGRRLERDCPEFAGPFYFMSWQFYMVQMLSRFCSKLSHLTITFDAQVPHAQDYLSPDFAKKALGHEFEFIRDLHRLYLRLTLNPTAFYHLASQTLKDFSNAFKAEKLSIRHLRVRGTKAYQKNLETGLEEIHPDAQAVKQWFSDNDIILESAEFSGEFEHRRIRNDGTVIPAENMEEINSGRFTQEDLDFYYCAGKFGPPDYLERGLCISLEGKLLPYKYV